MKHPRRQMKAMTKMECEKFLESLLNAVRVGAPATMVESHASDLRIALTSMCHDLESSKRELKYLRGMIEKWDGAE
jgi:hypothetical protein